VVRCFLGVDQIRRRGRKIAEVRDLERADHAATGGIATGQEFDADDQHWRLL